MDDLKEYNIYWKEKESDTVNMTFTVATDVETAWNKVILFKGGKNKVEILYAQEVNRGMNKLVGDPIPYEEYIDTEQL